jgi:hypothetical protein
MIPPPPRPVDSRSVRLMTWAAVILVVGADIAYVLLTRAQGGGPAESFTVAFIAGYVAVMAALMIVSLSRLPRPGWRMPLRGAAAGGLLVLGVLALMSVGLPLLIAGALATVATVRTLRVPQTRATLSAVASAVVAVAVLLTGFAVTGRIITCPPTGSMSGGGSGGFLSGPYYYDCVDGHLTYHSGTCNSDAIDANGHVTHPGC